MFVDKSNGSVCFNDETHTYWNKDDGGKYISVTTLISMLETPFDVDFWSAYKAAERVLSKEEWPGMRKRLLETRDISILDMGLIGAARSSLLEEWRKQNEESCRRGTEIHAELEKRFSGKSISLGRLDISGSYDSSSILSGDNIVCPEYLISYDFGGVRIAGQIDLLVKSGNDIIIVDWKTNKKISKRSYYDQRRGLSEKMKYPLNNLDNCNYMFYNMQLSTYAWMVERLNTDYIIKDLILVHFSLDGKYTKYHMKYLRSDVDKMIRWYGRYLCHEEQMSKYVKIDY